MTVVYGDTEGAVRAWLLTTSVAPLVTRPDGGVSIFQAMPSSAPVPSVVLTRSGGGPRRRTDMPEDAARITFHCWGTTRAQAGAIARALVNECENLARGSTFTANDMFLGAIVVARMFWLPDPESDTARYIVDTEVTAVSTA